MLITFDKDFGELAFRRGMPASSGIILLRIAMQSAANVALVVREEPDGIRRYVHVGTGNYHEGTARLYEDYGLLTSDRQVGEDITDLFNHLTGYSRRADYHRLLLPPSALRSGLSQPIAEPALVAEARAKWAADPRLRFMLCRGRNRGGHIEIGGAVGARRDLLRG